MISIIILQYGNAPMTIDLLRSLKETQGEDCEIIVVDNASPDGSYERVRDEFPGLSMVHSMENGGYGQGNNAGTELAKGDILLFLNNDTIATSDIVTQLTKHFSDNPGCGIAGLRLLNSDRSIQISAGRFPSLLSEWKAKNQLQAYSSRTLQNVDWVTGAALAIRTDLFRELGGFDDMFFMYFEDIDLCKRAHARGTITHALTEPSIIHLGGGSQPGGLSPQIQIEYRKSQMRYYSKHCSLRQQISLRLYLFLKYSFSLFSPEKHASARKIIQLIGAK